MVTFEGGGCELAVAQYQVHCSQKMYTLCANCSPAMVCNIQMSGSKGAPRQF